MQPRTGRRDWVWLGLAVVVALTVRVSAQADLAELPTSHYLVGDAELYDATARQILDRGWWPREPFSVAPLYPYLLAIVYQLSDSSLGAVRLLQALLGTASVLLLALTARRQFGRSAGLATASLAALYGALVFYDGLLLKPSATVFVLALALWLVTSRRGSPPSAAAAIGAGLALGASVLLRQNNLLVALAVVGVCAWQWRPTTGWRTGLTALVTGALLPLLAVSFVNRAVGGPWLPTSLHGAVNFYIGNGEVAQGTFVSISKGSQDPTSQLEDARRLARSIATGEGLPAPDDDRAAARVIVRTTVASMIEDPGRWLGLTARKTLWFWNAYEIPDAVGFELFRERSAWLTVAAVGFGMLVPLAFVGVALGLRDDEETVRAGTRLLAAGALAVMASVVVFFVFGRYRMPAVPFLLPLAGLGLAKLVDLAQPPRGRDRLVALGALAIGLVLVAWPTFDAADRAQHRTALYFNLGRAANRWASDLETEARASRQGETRVVATHAGRERATEAIVHLGRALDIDPEFPVARVEIAVAHLRRGNLTWLAGEPTAAVADYDRARDLLVTTLEANSERAPDELPMEMTTLLRTVESNRAAVTALGERRESEDARRDPAAGDERPE